MLTQNCNLEHYEKNYKDTYKKTPKTKEKKSQGNLWVELFTFLPCVVAVFVQNKVLTYPVMGATANNPLMCTLFLFGAPYPS